MGCDIHCYVEYRGEGRDRWSSFGSRINPGRNYRIFGRLAGVRWRDVPQVAPVRGMPEDAGFRAENDAWLYISSSGGDGYATPEEAARYHAHGSRYKNARDGNPAWIEHPDFHTHSWVTPDEWEKALDEDADELEYHAMLAAMRYIERQGYRVRVVFWFDN